MSLKIINMEDGTNHVNLANILYYIFRNTEEYG